MLTVCSNALELRGIANKTKKNGEVYYIVNCETDDGTHYGFYCADSSAFPTGLAKGDNVKVVFEVKYFENRERLVVRQVVKVAK